VKPGTVVSSWQKLLPDLEEDLQRLANEEMRKSKFTGMMYAVRRFENAGEWLQSNTSKLDFQHNGHQQSMPQNKTTLVAMLQIAVHFCMTF
jgi:predicted transcriptional regulator